jgi:hypothetical protein
MLCFWKNNYENQKIGIGYARLHSLNLISLSFKIFWTRCYLKTINTHFPTHLFFVFAKDRYKIEKGKAVLWLHIA